MIRIQVTYAQLKDILGLSGAFCVYMDGANDFTAVVSAGGLVFYYTVSKNDGAIKPGSFALDFPLAKPVISISLG